MAMVTPEMTPMARLADAIELWKGGRKNAAKTTWNSLPVEIRRVAIAVAMESLNGSLLPEHLFAITYDSPFGAFSVARGPKRQGAPGMLAKDVSKYDGEIYNPKIPRLLEPDLHAPLMELIQHGG